MTTKAFVDLKVTSEKELGKFFTLAGLGVSKLNMPVGFVDEVWHDMLNDKNLYSYFCNKNAGRFVEHIQSKGEGNLEWVSAYENCFGKLNPVWFINAEGQLNTQKYKEYLEKGEVRTEWNCSPIVTSF